MNEKTKVILIGAAMAAGAAVAGYFATLADGGAFGQWSAVVGAIAGAAVSFFASRKVASLLVVLLAIGIASTASAACRHITPMPTAYPADGMAIVGTMSGEVDNFWSTPITVRYGAYDWPADNGSGKCGGKGWQCLATFNRKANAWTISECWRANPVLFDRHTGRRLP